MESVALDPDVTRSIESKLLDRTTEDHRSEPAESTVRNIQLNMTLRIDCETGVTDVSSPNERLDRNGRHTNEESTLRLDS